MKKLVILIMPIKNYFYKNNTFTQPNKKLEKNISGLLYKNNNGSLFNFEEISDKN